MSPLHTRLYPQSTCLQSPGGHPASGPGDSEAISSVSVAAFKPQLHTQGRPLRYTQLHTQGHPLNYTRLHTQGHPGAFRAGKRQASKEGTTQGVGSRRERGDFERERCCFQAPTAQVSVAAFKPQVHTHRSSSEQLLHRHVQQFQKGLVFKAHKVVYHSTLDLRVITKKESTHKNAPEHLEPGSCRPPKRGQLEKNKDL